MLAILAITCPIFALIGLGFACVRLGLFARGDMAVLGRFVINIALPALMVGALSRRALAEILRLDYLMACAAAALCVYALALGLCLRRRGLGEGAVMAMGTAISNTAFMGFPIMLQVAPQVASLTVALNLLIENVLMLPLALALADLGARRDASRSRFAALVAVFATLARNPIIIAIFCGLALSCAGLTPPAPVLRALDMLGAVAAPVALFSVGGNLSGGPAGGEGDGRGLLGDAGLIAGIKLAVHPLLAGLIVCNLPGLTPDLRMAAIVFASMPVFSIYPLFGMRYGMARFCSTAVVLATLCSFVTISAAIRLAQLFVAP